MSFPSTVKTDDARRLQRSSLAFGLTTFRAFLLIICTIMAFFCIVLALFQPYKIDTTDKPSYSESLELDNFLVKPYFDDSQRRHLPNLRSLEWPDAAVANFPAGRKTDNGTILPLPDAYEPIMSRGQRALNKRLLRMVANMLNIRGFGNHFMVYGGTLLGSARHHDFIPWDDDVDLMVDLAIRKELQSMLKGLAPDYMLVVQSQRDKFCTRLMAASDEPNDYELSRNTSEYPWGWPYLDIGYYYSNSTHVCELAASYGRDYCWPTGIVFPLLYRPLKLEWYPTPFDLYKFIQMTYGDINSCDIYGYSHVIERGSHEAEKPCIEFHTRYAFVTLRVSRLKLHSTLNPELANRMLVVEESLDIRSGPNNYTAFHKLHLPLPKSNSNPII